MSECTVNGHFVADVGGGREGGEGCAVGSLFQYQNHASCFATYCGGVKLYLVVYSLSPDLLANDSVILATESGVCLLWISLQTVLPV